MARLAFQFAQASDKVRADVVEATEFPELSQRYEVRAVPKAVLNDSYELLGAVPDRELLRMVMLAGGRLEPEGEPPAAA